MQRFEVEENNKHSESLVERSDWKSNQASLIDTVRYLLSLYSDREVTLCNLCGFIITIFIFWALILVKHMAAYDSTDVDGTCRGIYSNLGYFPFTDITMARICPDWFEELSLGQWAGTKPFCYGGHTISTTTPRKHCFDWHESIDAQQYTIWKRSSICVKKVASVTNNTKTCPSGYTRCNKDLWVYGSLWPITYFEFSSTPSDRNETTGSSKTNFGVYLNFKREKQKLPVGVLRVSIGEDSPCLSMNEYSNQIDYAAIKEKGFGCLKYGVFPNYQRLDNDSAEHMFALQPWSTKPMQLPEFNKTLAIQNAYLTYAPRLELKDDPYCKSVDLEWLVYGSGNLEASSSTTTIFLWVIFLGLAYIAAKVISKQQIILLLCMGAMGIILTVGTVTVSKQSTNARSVLADV